MGYHCQWDNYQPVFRWSSCKQLFVPLKYRINFFLLGYWIGGKDRKPPTNDFVWTSRDVRVNIGATDWASGQPNNFKDNPENCMEMRKELNHKWNDTPCSRKQKYICQKRFVIGSAIPLIVPLHQAWYNIFPLKIVK